VRSAGRHRSSRLTSSFTSRRFRPTWRADRYTLTPASRCRSASCVRSRVGRVAILSADPLQPPSMQAQLPFDRTGSAHGGGGRAHRRAIAARMRCGLTCGANNMPGPKAEGDNALLEFARNHGATISTRRAPAGWAGTRSRWSTSGCACTAWRGCAWWTARDADAGFRKHERTRRDDRGESGGHDQQDCAALKANEAAQGWRPRGLRKSTTTTRRQHEQIDQSEPTASVRRRSRRIGVGRDARTAGARAAGDAVKIQTAVRVRASISTC